ncbi:MAG: hypothetical protein JWL94_904 [Microbacteriaceae bacterium]|nr:hypothetical protein [Microbacteriaceae bacterium]
MPARVLAECGPDAQIVAAEQVTVGGIMGFLARQHYEVTVVVPDHSVASARPSSSAGLATLLDDADEAEAQLQQAAAISTHSEQFDVLMDSLSFTEPPTAPARVAPPLMNAAGDLVALVGVWLDPLGVAVSMAASVNATVCIAGTVAAAGLERVDGRRSALGARASGVRSGRGTIVAVGLGSGRRGITVSGDMLRSIAADQVWVVVDASRKPEDTANWVAAVANVCPVVAMAVVGRHDTATPDSVDALGWPVGWVHGTSIG